MLKYHRPISLFWILLFSASPFFFLLSPSYHFLPRPFPHQIITSSIPFLHLFLQHDACTANPCIRAWRRSGIGSTEFFLFMPVRTRESAIVDKPRGSIIKCTQVSYWTLRSTILAQIERMYMQFPINERWSHFAPLLPRDAMQARPMPSHGARVLHIVV